MTRVNTKLATLFLLLVAAGGITASSVPGLPQKRRALNQAESWRKQPPKSVAPSPFALPAMRETRLENGLKIVFIEDHRSPIVTIVVGIPLALSPSKDIVEMTSQTALAEATAELITEGAGSRTSEQVARDVETLGGRLSSTANDDYAEVSVSVVAENGEQMMDLLGDVLLRPSFPESEIALYKRNRIQAVVVERQDPAFLAGEQFDRIVFGSHPYSISAPTPASINALDREKLVQFYRSNFRPDGSVAIVVGDFDARRMEAKARDSLSVWKEPAKAPARVRGAVFPNRTTGRVYLIHRPGSEQADFRIGALSIKRGHPEYFPLVVANAILGAGTGSRLFLNIREGKGYAYDVHSSVSSLSEAGTFYGVAQTRSEVTALAIKEMLAEFGRLSAVRVGQQELQNAKNFLSGFFSLSLSTQGGVAERIMQTYMMNLGGDYLGAFRSRIEAVTAEQVQEAARKYIASAHPVVVVVGDATKLVRSLRTIGPIEVLDTEGKPVKRHL